MKTHDDPEARFLSPLRRCAGEQERVSAPGIVFDFDADGKTVAVEILDATEHLASGADLTKLAAA